jgi:hypothetical protein
MVAACGVVGGVHRPIALQSLAMRAHQHGTNEVSPHSKWRQKAITVLNQNQAGIVYRLGLLKW